MLVVEVKRWVLAISTDASPDGGGQGVSGDVVVCRHSDVMRTQSCNAGLIEVIGCRPVWIRCRIGLLAAIQDSMCRPSMALFAANRPVSERVYATHETQVL